MPVPPRSVAHRKRGEDTQKLFINYLILNANFPSTGAHALETAKSLHTAFSLPSSFEYVQERLPTTSSLLTTIQYPPASSSPPPKEYQSGAVPTLVEGICADSSMLSLVSGGVAPEVLISKITFLPGLVGTGERNCTSISEIEILTLTPTINFNEELCTQLGIEVPAN